MLPKAVEEANRRAEEIHRQVYGNPEQPQPEAPAPAKEEPKAESQPEAPSPTAEQPPVEAIAEQKPDAKEGHPDYWKRRFDVVQGKYSVEIPRMAAEIRDLKGQLQDALARATAAATPPPSKLRPEEVEEYGEKFIDVVKRAAAEVVPEDVGQIKQQVDQLKNEAMRLGRERFFSELTRQAPQWERLNEDKDFLTWLAGVDPFAGRARQDLFDQATSQMDAWRVANFFNSYGSEQPAAATEPDPITQQIEPPTSRVAAPPPGKKVWSTSEIGRFYADVRARKVNPEDARRIEADIFAAQTEGRIR